MLKITYLKPTVGSAAKTYYKDEHNKIQAKYTAGPHFDSLTESYVTLSEAFEGIKTHAAEGRCVLKGHTKQSLNSQRRKGQTDPDEKTNWALLDIDGVTGFNTVEEFMDALGFQDVSYIIQYSASMGIESKPGLRAHVFVLLDDYYAPSHLKEWLKHLNFKHDFLERQLELTASYTGLKWPLDITTCQNDKLIFIAPPICTGGVIDQFEGPRIQYRSAQKTTITPEIPAGFTAGFEKQLHRKINDLREAKGLVARPYATKVHNSGVEYLKDPDKATITGVKQDGEFIRINLNGGDSWAYYHPTSNAEIIYNFKGEPNYLTKDIAPDYYISARTKALAAKRDLEREEEREYLTTKLTGQIFLAVRDPTTDTYYTVSYDYDTKELKANPAKSKDRLMDFLKDNDRPQPEFIPDWDVDYFFDTDEAIDVDARKINLFKPTKYLLAPPTQPSSKETCPPTIQRLITHVCGNDTATASQFINWLAYIVQNRETPRTAWLLHGTFGTGKGLLFSEVIKPIFGDAALKKPFTDFDDKFNSQLLQSLLVFVDETDLHSSSNGDRLMQRFKNLITEKEISVRAMRQDYRECYNRTGYIFASNEAIPLNIQLRDRRWHVAPRQDVPLKEVVKDPETFITQIHKELDAFAHFLHSYQVDSSKARFPEDSLAKIALQQLATTTPAMFAENLKQGNLAFFMEFVPTSIVKKGMKIPSTQELAYMGLIQEIVTQAAQDREMFIPRDDLQTLYMYTTNERLQSTAKFTRMMKGYQVDVDVRRRINSQPTKGAVIKWQATDIDLADYKRALHLGDNDEKQQTKETVVPRTDRGL